MRQTECIRLIAGESIAYKLVLRGRTARHTYRVEAHIRCGRLEHLAAQRARLRGDAGSDTGGYRVHHRHGLVVAYLIYLFGKGEVEQSKLLYRHAYLYPLLGGQGVVVVLDYHVLKLLEHVVAVGLGVGSAYIDANHYVGRKIRAHHIDRKVVVDAAVVHQHTVDFDRLEHHRKRHGGAYGVTQRTGTHHYLVLVVDVGGNAAEGHEKPVEVASALRGIPCEKVHESEVHG